MGDVGASIQQAWNGLLSIVGRIVSPDWNSLVLLIPIGIVGLLGLYVLATGGAWTVATVLHPRPRVRYEAGPRPLARGADGSPVLPLGLPFSVRTGLVYPFGSQRTEDGEDLSVVCPMCRLERPAGIPTCGNCGLVLRIATSLQVAPPAGPPPGGAAAA